MREAQPTRSMFRLPTTRIFPAMRASPLPASQQVGRQYRTLNFEPVLDQRIAVFVDWISQHPAERHREGVVQAFEGPHQLLRAAIFETFRAPILFFSLLEKLGGASPGEGHVRLFRRAPVELDLSSIEVDGPGESPVFEYPEHGKARLANMLAHVAVASGEHQGPLDQPPRRALREL